LIARVQAVKQFNIYDLDGSNSIDAVELSEAMVQLGIDKSHEEVCVFVLLFCFCLFVWWGEFMSMRSQRHCVPPLRHFRTLSFYKLVWLFVSLLGSLLVGWLGRLY
jgi:hypothetical protein